MPITTAEHQALLDTKAAKDAAHSAADTADAAHDAAVQQVLARAETELPAEGDIAVLSDKPVPAVQRKNGKVELVTLPPYVGA